MSAINTSQVALLQGYVRKFHKELFERAFFSFESLDIANLITGIKGHIVLTDLQIGELSKRANPIFVPSPNVITYRPRTLYTEPVDVDVEIKPKLLADSYLEGLRKAGQNNADIPWEGQVMGGLMNKIRQEQEFAFWQAKKTATPAVNDPLLKLFDGVHEKLAKLRTTGGHIPVPVSTGVYTPATLGKNINEMFESLGAEAIMYGVEAFSNRKILTMYIDYLKSKSNFQMPQVKRNKAGLITGVELENGQGWLYTKPGFGASQTVFMTQPTNICWGTDELGDSDTLEIVQLIKKVILGTLTYRVGLEFRNVDQDYLAVNDL